MKKVLAVVEGRDVGSTGHGSEVVSAAARLADGLGGEAHALVIGGSDAGSGAEALGRSGARLVKRVAHPSLESYHPEGYAHALAAVVRSADYDAVLLSASDMGKDLAPRAAAMLDVPLAQDITGLAVADGEIEVTRPVYAGKAVARVRIDAVPLVATLRRNAFPATSEGEPAEIETVAADPDPEAWMTEIVSFRETAADIPDVSQASIVVSGGRGMKGPEHWTLLEDLRAAFGPEAGLGASRAVVDAGWRPHSEQVGQTGKTVSPRLYLAIAVSGAIQHLAGMRTAGTIVAVNRDPDAPIFKIADYGIVGDAFEVVPRLTEELRGLNESG